MIDFEELQKPQRALLVGIQDDDTNQTQAKEHLEELARLVDTLGAESAGIVMARISKAQPKLYVGSGKAEEIVQAAEELEVDFIVFDDELSPTHQRNWERLAKIPVVDRQQIIIDIFAQRAQTREARLQVELAQMEYSLPRLTRAWTHLSRQRGGTKGTRGEGETQLEMDRRATEKKIAKTKEELKVVRKQRATLRKSREAVPVPTAALVGYTNAGKSSLLVALTQAQVLVEDKLFATLDPTTRRYDLGAGRTMLLTDTVGFIRKLPHGLVDAFHSTLEETLRADVLIHLLDASNPEVMDHYSTTMEVLKEIGAHEIPMLLAFNKVDILDGETLNFLHQRFPDGVFISAKTGKGLEELGTSMVKFMEEHMVAVDLRLPFAREDLAAMCHRNGSVEEKTYDENGIHLKARIPGRLVTVLEPYFSPAQ